MFEWCASEVGTIVTLLERATTSSSCSAARPLTAGDVAA
jgi:hypothetical protein